jgi:hypothetical protein
LQNNGDWKSNGLLIANKGNVHNEIIRGHSDFPKRSFKRSFCNPGLSENGILRNKFLAVSLSKTGRKTFFIESSPLEIIMTIVDLTGSREIQSAHLAGGARFTIVRRS